MTRRVGALGLALGAVAVGLLALPSSARGTSTQISSILDFVTFDRIDYIRWAEEPGRTLDRGDLGIEFATVGCSVGEDVRNCTYGLDAAAAYLPAGTRMYEVRGYTTDFRLAAVVRDRVFLYQAWRNPRAKTGADLFAIAGKVRAVDVQRGVPTPATTKPSKITAARDVAALVDMIARGTMRAPRAHAIGETRYWLTFWLADGTTLGRPYFPDTSELMGGVVVPTEFRSILERYLPD